MDNREKDNTVSDILSAFQGEDRQVSYIIKGNTLKVYLYSDKAPVAQSFTGTNDTLSVGPPPELVGIFTFKLDEPSRYKDITALDPKGDYLRLDGKKELIGQINACLDTEGG